MTGASAGETTGAAGVTSASGGTGDASSFDLTGFPGYRVELVAGDTVIGVDDDARFPAEGQFEESTISVTTEASDPLAGQPVSIRLINLNMAHPGIEVNFDDVRLDAAPAP